MSRKFLTFICICFTLVSCIKRSPEQFEQEVFDDIFIQVVELTYKDLRIYSNPPRPGEENDPEFKRKIEFLKRDTLGLVLAIDHNRNTDFQKYNNKKFHFKNVDEFSREEWMLEYQSWKSKYSKFAGSMSFSKIEFNKDKNKGKMEVHYSCGGNCGLGYEVYLEKIKNKWTIRKVEDKWIS